MSNGFRHLLIAVFLAVTLIPSVEWIGDAWAHSPIDAAGPYFAALAVAWWALAGWMTGCQRGLFDPSGLPLAVVALLLGVAGILLDVRLFIAASSLLAAFALAWVLLGSSRGLALLPALVLGLLALPATAHLLNEAWLSTGFSSPGPLVSKAVIALPVVLAGLYLLARQRGRKPVTAGAFSVTMAVLVLVAAATLLAALKPPRFGPPVLLDESDWAFGNWLGAEIEASPSEERLYGSARLSKRVYANSDGQSVALLIVESDDVHRLHAPEYCLSGSGWVMDRRETSTWTVDGEEAIAARLSASRNEIGLKSVYWFSSGNRSTTNLAGLRLGNRIAGDETFTLYMATAIGGGDSSQDELLNEFLEDAPWLIPSG